MVLKYLLIISLLFCLKSDAQSDSTDTAKNGIHIFHLNYIGDTLKLYGSGISYIKFYKNKKGTYTYIYADADKNKIDTTIKIKK